MNIRSKGITHKFQAYNEADNISYNLTVRSGNEFGDYHFWTLTVQAGSDIKDKHLKCLNLPPNAETIRTIAHYIAATNSNIINAYRGKRSEVSFSGWAVHSISPYMLAETMINPLKLNNDYAWHSQSKKELDGQI